MDKAMNLNPGTGLKTSRRVLDVETRLGKTQHRLAVCGVLALLISGCASSAAPLTRSGPAPAAASPAAPATAGCAATSPSAVSSGKAAQELKVTPAAGLSSGQTVLVTASGFAPCEALVVIECAAKGAATTSGDCDTAALQGVTSDASGQVMIEFQVTKGPFGASNIVCGASQACLISVTQATESPTQEADERISFR